MSKRGRRLAADVVAAVQMHAGITKAAGGADALHAVALPLAEIVVKQNRAIARTSKAIRRQAKALQRIAGAPPARPFTPPARGMVPMRPGEWNVKLTPAGEPSRNGFHVADPDGDEDRDGQQHDSGGWS